MTIKYRYWEYSFRECDVKGMTREELEDLAAKTGKMQYEPNRVWLLVPGVGYGLETRDFEEEL
jgi:hypothetical protein